MLLHFSRSLPISRRSDRDLSGLIVCYRFGDLEFTAGISFPNFSSTAGASAGGTPSNTDGFSSGGSDVAAALMEVATELSQNCPVPGVSEAASLMTFLVKLVSDSRGNSRGVEERLRRCRSVITLLENASKVFGKVRGDATFRTNSLAISGAPAFPSCSCSRCSWVINIECFDIHTRQEVPQPWTHLQACLSQPSTRRRTRMARQSGMFSKTSATPSPIWWT